jgi:hypothetical protein
VTNDLVYYLISKKERRMSVPTTTLIANAVNIPRHSNPVSYDPSYSGPSGYWLCRQCKIIAYAGGEFPHNKICPLYNMRERDSDDHQDMIFVVGSKVTKFHLPDQSVKRIAKINFYIRSRL